jgi:hypothetical protein
MQALPHNYKTQTNEIFEYFGVDNNTPVESFGSTTIVVEYIDGSMKKHEYKHLTKALTWGK